jgi:tRNA 2-selenouridine synthase
MSKRLSAAEFIEQAGSLPVADTRSPGEYNTGHIPGSVNIPLFTDSERERVGIVYKKGGRRDAVLEGLKLTGPAMAGKLSEAIEIAKGNQLLVYCWRGGMRSESMSWLFSLGGLEPSILDGGYKAYRNHILGELAVKRDTVILGGMTGSGKTEILKVLAGQGEQTADLENIAVHRGSAFGSLGQGNQPSTEHFANLLYEVWKGFDYKRVIWLEDESRNIGTVFLPELFWQNMHESPVIAIISDASVRIPRLVEEYSVFPAEQLIAAVNRISRRLGGDRSADAVRAISSGDFAKAAEITLSYYDKTYLYSLQQRNPQLIHTIRSESGDAVSNAALVMEFARDKGLL